jgi:hypothetical protein
MSWLFNGLRLSALTIGKTIPDNASAGEPATFGIAPRKPWFLRFQLALVQDQARSGSRALLWQANFLRYPRKRHGQGLHHWLQRRPATTFGCIFVAGNFTQAAVTKLDMLSPQRIIYWNGSDMDFALNGKDLAEPLEKKYRDLVRYGMARQMPHLQQKKHARRGS